MKRIVSAAILGATVLGGATAGQAQYVDASTIPGQPANAAGNVVGGGIATMYGGGEERVIVYSRPGAGIGNAAPPVQRGRLARMTGGSGDGPEVEYLEPAPQSRGREAWMVGGGDQTEVVYSLPRPRR